MKIRVFITIGAAIIMATLVAAGPGTSGKFSDNETSNGNMATAWTSTPWIQTSQADFNAGVLNNVDISTSPGSVQLAVSSGWYQGGWLFRKQITIAHTRVTATLTNFPVMINLTADADLAPAAQSNGNDILFTASNGTTKLNHEIERYVNSTGQLVAWVLVPSLSSTTDTIIFLYYGNASSGNQQNPTGVWNSAYQGVWHLNETSGTSINDSTSNHNTGMAQSGVTVNATGQIDGAESFNGTTGWTSLGTSSTLNFGVGAPFTIEGWFKTTDSYGSIVSFRSSTNDNPVIDICVGYDGATTSAGRLMALVRDDNNTGNYAEVVYTTAVNNGSWHYFVLTRNAGNTIQLYCDGVLRGTNSSTGAGGAITTDLKSLGSERRWVQVGFTSTDNEYLTATIDEVRVSNALLSSSWISTCYNNQSSPATFYALAAKTGVTYISSGTIASAVFNTNIIGARWDALIWDRTLPAGTNITFEVRANPNNFLPGTPDATIPWTTVGGTSPADSGLPSGAYKQWRATLTTTISTNTPTLIEVRMYYCNNN
jgi:hypothetical protein